MQKPRRGIEAIGPHHRSCLVIDPDLPEVLGIAQRLPKQRTRWKRPIENAQRGELDLSDLIAVLGMEVRRRMIGGGTSR